MLRPAYRPAPIGANFGGDPAGRGMCRVAGRSMALDEQTARTVPSASLPDAARPGQVAPGAEEPMPDADPGPAQPLRRERDREAWAWLAAVVIALGVHGGGLWTLMNWQPVPDQAGAAPPAIIVDLAPLAAASDAPAQDVAPGPPTSEADPETSQPPDMSEPAPPEPVMDTSPPDPPSLPSLAPPADVAELPQTTRAEAVLPPPVKTPTPPKPRPVEPKIDKKQPPKPVVEREKPTRVDRTRQRQASAPPAVAAPRRERSAAPSASASSASPKAAASWKGSLIAHLNRYKRYPPGATGAGTVSVTFTIGRSGQVLSARLTGSSGDAALDQEAASLPRRASPVPAPPEGFGGGGSITLNLPIRFSRQ